MPNPTWRPATELAEKLGDAAHITGRSMNAIVNEAVEQWIAANIDPVRLKQARDARDKTRST